jgi:hypothetical protein
MRQLIVHVVKNCVGKLMPKGIASLIRVVLILSEWVAFGYGNDMGVLVKRPMTYLVADY